MPIEFLFSPVVPLAFGFAFLAVTALRSVSIVWRSGKSPLVIDRTDPILGFAGVVFAAVTLGLLAYFVLFALGWPVEWAMGAIPRENAESWRLASLVVMTSSFAVMTAAQWSMGKSWRIGIDQAETLELRTQGLFAVSRNPIFLGMLGLVVGLAIWSPTAVTVAALAVSYVALEVQIRAEEAYLERTLGDPYRAYRARTPRWL